VANRRAAASNSADGMNLIDGPANQRKALALNEKQLAANHCNELFASQVGAAGFEPTTLLTLRNERAFRNKPTLVKERVVVRHCEATSHRVVAFGLEESARRTYRVRILLISKNEFGLHIVCNFGGQAPFRSSFLDLKGGKKHSKSLVVSRLQ
jgi:hypothetical protein